MTVTLLIVAVIIGLFALIVYGMISSEKKRLIRKKEALLALGFQTVENPDSSLLKNLITLYTKRESQKLSLRNMYQRRENNYLLYLYEVWSETSDGQELQEKWGLAMVTPYLNLPRFTLIPKIDMTGRFASLVNRLLEKVTVQGNVKIEFTGHQQFSSRYLVTGKDESAVRQLFSDRLLKRLSETSYLQVDGNRNFLIFSRYDLKRGKQKREMEDLTSRLEEARSFFKLMMEEAAVR
jgi:hypothetical protein